MVSAGVFYIIYGIGIVYAFSIAFLISLNAWGTRAPGDRAPGDLQVSQSFLWVASQGKVG